MGAITHEVIAPNKVQLNTVKNYSNLLQQWHNSLPPVLTLKSATNSSCESPRRTSTLLIHCSYLSSVNQLTRRFLIERVTAQLAGGLEYPGSCPVGWGSSMEDCVAAEEFCKKCVDSAKQLAMVCNVSSLPSSPILTGLPV